MKIVPFDQISEYDWDNVIQESDDGWLFASYSFLKMVEGIPCWNIENCGIGVYIDNSLVGVCPLQVAWGLGGVFSNLMGDGGPIVKKNIPKAQREKIIQFLIDEAKSVAEKRDLKFLEFHVSPLARGSLLNVRGVNPLVEFGFEDISTHSWIVDLSEPLEEIYKRFSRAARREIQEAVKKGYQVRDVFDRSEMNAYYDIHCETYHRTGANPFPKEYFLGIYDYFTCRGVAQTLVATDRSGLPVAFANIGVFKNQALYWTVCCRDHDFNQGVYYQIVWHAIKCAKERGNAFFETSEAFPNAKPGSKLKGLNDFKRKFGGKLFRYFKARLLLDLEKAPSNVGLPVSVFSYSLVSYLKAWLKSPVLATLKENSKPFFLPIWKKLQPVAHFLRSGSFIPFLKPYWHERERMILLNPRDVTEIARKDCEDKLRKFMAISDQAFIGLTGSGRGALGVALRGLKRLSPERKMVVLPTYCCHGVMNPIVENGLTPRFVDIGENLLATNEACLKSLGSDVLALIVIHSGGQTNYLPDVEKRARELGVFLIQDHCQNFQSGHFLMTEDHSDIDLLSFGLGKNVQATAGGAVISYIFPQIFAEEYSLLPEEELSLSNLRARIYRTRFFRDSLISSFSQPIVLPQTSNRNTKISLLDASLVMAQLPKVDTIIKRRTLLAQRFNCILNKRTDLFQIPHSEKSIFTKNSIVCRNISVKRALQAFSNEKNFELENMYCPLHLQDKGSAYRGSEFFPRSEGVWRRVLNLPVRPNLSTKEEDLIARALEEFVEKHE